MTSWVLVHSPLLSAAFWEEVAMVLRQRGQYVVTPGMGDAMNAAGGYAPAQADLIAQVVGSGPVTLVAHSGAGPLLPTIAERLSRRSLRVTGSVFADAGLPHPGRSRLEMLPRDCHRAVA